MYRLHPSRYFFGAIVLLLLRFSEASIATRRLPVPPFSISINDCTTSTEDIGRVQTALTSALQRLLSAQFGDCLVGIDLDLNVVDPSFPNDDVRRIRDYNVSSVMSGSDTASRRVHDLSNIIVQGKASFHCEGSSIDSIEASDIYKIIETRIETIRHIASISMRSQSESNLYQSLVKVAFSTQDAFYDSATDQRYDGNFTTSKVCIISFKISNAFAFSFSAMASISTSLTVMPSMYIVS